MSNSSNPPEGSLGVKLPIYPKARDPKVWAAISLILGHVATKGILKELAGKGKILPLINRLFPGKLPEEILGIPLPNIPPIEPPQVAANITEIFLPTGTNVTVFNVVESVIQAVIDGPETYFSKLSEEEKLRLKNEWNDSLEGAQVAEGTASLAEFLELQQKGIRALAEKQRLGQVALISAEGITQLTPSDEPAVYAPQLTPGDEPPVYAPTPLVEAEPIKLRQSNIVRLINKATKVIGIYSCISMVLALAWRAFSMMKNEKNAKDVRTGFRLIKGTEQNFTITPDQEDSPVIKFVKYSINTHDPFKAIFILIESVKKLFEEDEDEEFRRFRDSLVGESVVSFLRDCSILFSCEATSLAEDQSVSFNVSLEHRHKSAIIKHFVEVLGFLLNHNKMDKDHFQASSELKFEHDKSKKSNNYVISFDKRVLDNECNCFGDFPVWPGGPLNESRLDNLKRFLISRKSGQGGPGGGLGMTTSTCKQEGNRILLELTGNTKGKNGDLIGVELVRKNQDKEPVEYASWLPEGFCDPEQSKVIDTILLSPLDNDVASKLRSLNTMRKSSCPENACGAVRVEAAVGTTNNIKCLAIKFDVDLFPFPQTKKNSEFLLVVQGKDLEAERLKNRMPGIRLTNSVINTKYITQRVSPFVTACSGYSGLPSGATLTPNFIQGFYPAEFLTKYKNDIKAGLHENLRIGSGVHSEEFKSKCSLSYTYVDTNEVLQRTGNFVGLSKDDLEGFRDKYLNDQRQDLRNEGYLEQFIIKEKGQINSGRDGQFIEYLGDFFTRTRHVSDADTEKLALLNAGKISKGNTGESRFTFSTGMYTLNQTQCELITSGSEQFEFFLNEYSGTGATVESASAQALSLMQTAATTSARQFEAYHYAVTPPLSQETATFYTFDAGASREFTSFGISPKFLVKLAATNENPNLSPVWNELSTTEVSFTSEILATSFLNGPPPLNENTGWVSHVDQAFSRFLNENNRGKKISDFNRTIERPLRIVKKTINFIGWEVLPSTSINIDVWVLESTDPHKQAKVTYTRKALPTEWSVILTAKEVLIVNRYRVNKDRPKFSGTATIKVQIPIYRACYSEFGTFPEGAPQRKAEIPTGLTGRKSFIYTYPSNMSQVYIDKGAPGILNSQINIKTGESRTIVVPPSWSGAVSNLNAGEPQDTTFIGGWPVINLRHEKEITRKIYYQKTRGGGIKREPPFTTFEMLKDADVPKQFDSIENMQTFIMAAIHASHNSPRVVDIGSEQEEPERKSESGIGKNKQVKTEKIFSMEFSWTSDLRVCNCGSPSSEDFSKNLYSGETYLMRVKRTIVAVSPENMCVEKTLSKDGRFLFTEDPGIRVYETTVVKLFDMNRCPSLEPENYLKLLVH